MPDAARLFVFKLWAAAMSRSRRIGKLNFNAVGIKKLD